jgi:hypothetical protein
VGGGNGGTNITCLSWEKKKTGPSSGGGGGGWESGMAGGASGHLYRVQNCCKSHANGHKRHEPFTQLEGHG